MEAVDRVGAGADVGLGGGPCGRPWGRVEMRPSSATTGGHKGPPPTSTLLPPLRERLLPLKGSPCGGVRPTNICDAL